MDEFQFDGFRFDGVSRVRAGRLQVTRAAARHTPSCLPTCLPARASPGDVHAVLGPRHQPGLQVRSSPVRRAAAHHAVAQTAFSDPVLGERRTTDAARSQRLCPRVCECSGNYQEYFGLNTNVDACERPLSVAATPSLGLAAVRPSVRSRRCRCCLVSASPSSLLVWCAGVYLMLANELIHTLHPDVSPAQRRAVARRRPWGREGGGQAGTRLRGRSAVCLALRVERAGRAKGLCGAAWRCEALRGQCGVPRPAAHDGLCRCCREGYVLPPRQRSTVLLVPAWRRAGRGDCRGRERHAGAGAARARGRPGL